MTDLDRDEIEERQADRLAQLEAMRLADESNPVLVQVDTIAEMLQADNEADVVYPESVDVLAAEAAEAATVAAEVPASGS